MIESPYVLFTRIPLFKAEDGDLYCDRLWAKDLMLHLDYIANLSICCPVVEGVKEDNYLNISNIGLRHFYALKKDYGLVSVLCNFFPNFKTVFSACRAAKIVHSSGAGWAFPLSFYILLIRIVLKFKWVLVIESSFWMLAKNERSTLRRKIESYIFSRLLKRCVVNADCRIFTQSFYRKYFLGDNEENSLINPATWIDEELILGLDEVHRIWGLKQDGPIKILYPSRLEVAKGARVVLDALRSLSNSDIELELDIIGKGSLANEYNTFVRKYDGPVKVRFLTPVDYGEPFFSLLRKYHYVLVPTLNQEQPRIIFDAFSQGVPILGSDTSGILDVASEDNACFFKSGEAESLANLLAEVSRDRSKAYEKAIAGRSYVSGKTHLNMHKTRAEFLQSRFKT